MKKAFLILIAVFSITLFAGAQDYNNGIGIRGGYYNGLTFKHFISSGSALEGLLFSSVGRGGFELTGLYEKHKNAFDVDRLNWYYGGGAHIGFYDMNVVGIDFILGIEYNISEIPVNIGLDWKPSFDIIGDSQFWGDGAALSIRYIF